MSVAIAKWGNSAALRLPKSILDTLSLHIGDSVNLILKDSRLTIEPCKPTKPSLEQLLAKITTENQHSDLFKDSAGKELI